MAELADTFIGLIEAGDTYLFLVPIYVLLLSGERLYDLVWTRRAWDNRDAAVNILITILTLGLNVGLGHLVPLALMAFILRFVPKCIQINHQFTGVVLSCGVERLRQNLYEQNLLL